MTLSSRNRNVIDEFHRGHYSVVKEMYDEYYASLIDFATQLIVNKTEAHHIAQEVCIKLFMMRDRFSTLPDIKAFLYITVRNICFAYIKAEKDEQPGDDITWYEQSLITTARVDDGAVREEALCRITAMMSELPEAEQTIFRSVFCKRLLIPDVAQQLKLTAVVVTQRRIQAINLLREKLVAADLFSVPLFVYFVTVFCGAPTE